MRFETRLSAHLARVLNWALSHLFLFACLELYLFVQMTRRRARCFCPWDAALCVCTKHGAHVLSPAFPHLLIECFKLYWMFKVAKLKNSANDKLSWLVTTHSSGPSTVLSVFLGWPHSVEIIGPSPSAVGPPQPWAPNIVTTFQPTSDGPAHMYMYRYKKKKNTHLCCASMYICELFCALVSSCVGICFNVVSLIQSSKHAEFWILKNIILYCVISVLWVSTSGVATTKCCRYFLLAFLALLVPVFLMILVKWLKLKISG